MAKVKRSTPAPPPVTSTAAAMATTDKTSVSSGEANAAAKVSAVASPPIVIEIPSSPDPSVGSSAKGGRSSKKKGRKRPAPRPLDLDDGIEMWTPREKRRLDDECHILAGDPLAAIIELAPLPAAANDDIAVVAERGKVACRDFPHPRSACAKHPFGATPHDCYCDKCFCYVCDVAAPCVSWKGPGGHCHASDRDKKWKTLRLMRQKATQTKPS